MIYLSPPHLSGREYSLIEKALNSNMLAGMGEFVSTFEESLCKYTKSSQALAVSSATAALHLALKVARVGKDDIVLASSFTFIGGVAPALYLGARLVFIDSDESLNVDIELLEKGFKKYRPKAFILTYLYGICPKADEIARLCKKYEVILIEDAAEALGSFYEDRAAGTFGDFGFYSFNGNKLLTTGGGGILLAKDAKNLKKARFYANWAKEEEEYYQHIECGFNYKMSNINASLGVAGMDIIEERVAKKRWIYEQYKQALGEFFIFFEERKGARDNKWLSICLLKNDLKTKEINPRILKLIHSLKAANIEARMMWKPMHLQPLFKDNEAILNKNSEKFFYNGVCLPSGTALEEKDIEKICKICLKSLKS